MASLLAHEINNPLAALTNFLFLLKQEPLPSPAKEFACRANDELTRINRIAAMTMGFYFENEAPGPLHICQMINEVALVLNSTQIFKDVQIKREFKCDPIIVASAPRIRQLIANLLTNALESGAKSVRVRVRRCLDWHRQGGPGVRVTISDDGCGIRPEIRGRIFEPFFSTKAERGTGLGLWASQTILLRNNGTIKVRSSISGPAKGPCLSFFWPTPPDRRVLNLKSARERAAGDAITVTSTTTVSLSTAES
jgi:signal transduction histidine kinase